MECCSGMKVVEPLACSKDLRDLPRETNEYPTIARSAAEPPSMREMESPLHAWALTPCGRAALRRCCSCSACSSASASSAASSCSCP